MSVRDTLRSAREYVRSGDWYDGSNEYSSELWSPTDKIRNVRGHKNEALASSLAAMAFSGGNLLAGVLAHPAGGSAFVNSPFEKLAVAGSAGMVLSAGIAASFGMKAAWELRKYNKVGVN